MKAVFALLIVTGGLFIAACGDGDEAEPPATRTPDQSATADTYNTQVLATATAGAEVTQRAADATALALATITPTPITGVVQATPPAALAAGSDSPVAGICAEPQQAVATVVMDVDVPNPRCTIVRPDQRIRIENQRDETVDVMFGVFEVTLDHNEAVLLDLPVGEYLGPGFHGITMNGQGFGEVGVLEADDPRRLPN